MIFVQSPISWRYSLFPIEVEHEEKICLDDTVRIALDKLDAYKNTGDYALLGEIPHWAHILKANQSEKGDWYKYVNGRTGEPLGDEKTLTPLKLFIRLREIMNSSEYDHAISLSHEYSNHL